MRPFLTLLFLGVSTRSLFTVLFFFLLLLVPELYRCRGKLGAKGFRVAGYGSAQYGL